LLFHEDWLDNRKDSKRGSIRPAQKGKKKGQDFTYSPLSETNASIIEVYPKLCRVLVDHSDQELLCSYRRAGVFQKEADGSRERTPVSVGDRVVCKILGSQDGVVEGIAERKNYLARLAPGRSELIQHVIVANLEVLIIVASAKDPEFSASLIDRFLIAASLGNVPVALVITKTDLLAKDQQKNHPKSQQRPWSFYHDKLGIPLFETSTVSNSGIEPLVKFI
jgi:putative ribosome biogenesis GTPase RsgA